MDYFVETKGKKWLKREISHTIELLPILPPSYISEIITAILVVLVEYEKDETMLFGQKNFPISPFYGKLGSISAMMRFEKALILANQVVSALESFISYLCLCASYKKPADFEIKRPSKNRFNDIIPCWN